MDKLEVEAKRFGLKVVLDALKKYAPFREKPSEDAKCIEINIKKKRKADKIEKDSSSIQAENIKIDSKRICISESPVKDQSDYEIEIEGKIYNIIDSSYYEYDFGRFAFFSPICRYSVVALDATLPQLDQLADEFIELWNASQNNNEPFQLESLFVKFGRFMHLKKSIIDNLAYQRTFKDGPVCRQFSLYSAVLFSKILFKFGVSNIRIQIFACRTYNSDWKSVHGEAHAWNLISVFHEKKPNKYYACDFYNRFLVDLDLEAIKNRGSADLLQLIELNEKELRIGTLTKIHFMYKYIIFTIQRRFYKEVQIESFYSESKKEFLNTIGAHLEKEYVEPWEDIKIRKYIDVQKDEPKK